MFKNHHVHRNLQMFEIIIQTQNDLKSFQAWLRPLMQQSRSEDYKQIQVFQTHQPLEPK